MARASTVVDASGDGLLADRISRIDVSVTDENGPKGGRDMLCRVQLLIRGHGRIVTTAVREKPIAAVAAAASRARRVATQRLKRPLRRRREHAIPPNL